MSEVNIVFVPATYEVTLELNQEQLDWLSSFCGEIAGHYESPLRQVTDSLYYELKKNRSKIVNVSKTNWVTFTGEHSND